jgi:hypothetical protein
MPTSPVALSDIGATLPVPSRQGKPQAGHDSLLWGAPLRAQQSGEERIPQTYMNRGAGFSVDGQQKRFYLILYINLLTVRYNMIKCGYEAISTSRKSLKRQLRGGGDVEGRGARGAVY